MRQRTVGGRLPREIPAEHYQTYKIISPSDRPLVAACQDAGCEFWTTGWDTLVDETTDLGAAQARYFRSGQSGRTFRELGRNGAGLTVFRFEAHQRCFTDHQTIPEVFGVVGGDYRGNPRGESRRHANADDWVEDFAEHQDRIKTARERG